MVLHVTVEERRAGVVGDELNLGCFARQERRDRSRRRQPRAVALPLSHARPPRLRLHDISGIRLKTCSGIGLIRCSGIGLISCHPERSRGTATICAITTVDHERSRGIASIAQLGGFPSTGMLAEPDFPVANVRHSRMAAGTVLPFTNLD